MVVDKRGIGLLVATLLIGMGGVAAYGATITNWTFESYTPPAAATTSAGPFAAEEGTGNATVIHAVASTFGAVAGNGSAKSLSSNTWTTGDYDQFVVPTTGHSGIFLQWDQTRSGTGPATFDLLYSTDGISFTTALDDYTVLTNASPPGTWSSGSSRIPDYVRTVDLSAVTALDNQPSVTFRLVSQVTSAVAGTNRVDNFLVSEGPPPTVPEPAMLGLLGVIAFSALGGRRRLVK